MRNLNKFNLSSNLKRNKLSLIKEDEYENFVNQVLATNVGLEWAYDAGSYDGTGDIENLAKEDYILTRGTGSSVTFDEKNGIRFMSSSITFKNSITVAGSVFAESTIDTQRTQMLLARRGTLLTNIFIDGMTNQGGTNLGGFLAASGGSIRYRVATSDHVIITPSTGFDENDYFLCFIKKNGTTTSYRVLYKDFGKNVFSSPTSAGNSSISSSTSFDYTLFSSSRVQPKAFSAFWSRALTDQEMQDIADKLTFTKAS